MMADPWWWLGWILLGSLAAVAACVALAGTVLLCWAVVRTKRVHDGTDRWGRERPPISHWRAVNGDVYRVEYAMDTRVRIHTPMAVVVCPADEVPAWLRQESLVAEPWTSE